MPNFEVVVYYFRAKVIFSRYQLQYARDETKQLYYITWGNIKDAYREQPTLDTSDISSKELDEIANNYLLSSIETKDTHLLREHSSK